ncbi:MAG: gluconate 2-dehydrogenase subunit 3 family protein [Thermoanaerobaculia bacterium]
MSAVSSQPALTAERREVLRAVVERILPGSLGTGAAETDAAAGFESAVLHPFFRGLRPGIEALLDQLQAGAGQLHGKGFSACAPGEQDEMLRALEADPSPWTRLLFRFLIWFSLEGFLGDPVHGGNRSFGGWEFIGLRAGDMRSGLCLGAQGDR